MHSDQCNSICIIFIETNCGRHKHLERLVKNVNDLRADGFEPSIHEIITIFTILVIVTIENGHRQRCESDTVTARAAGAAALRDREARRVVERMLERGLRFERGLARHTTRGRISEERSVATPSGLRP